jgi:hypothetical protein
MGQNLPTAGPASRYSYQSGTTTATVTIAAGYACTMVQAHNTSGGASLVITPANGTALPTITIPAGANWFVLTFRPEEQELVDGSTLAFTGTDAYYVQQKYIGGV